MRVVVDNNIAIDALYPNGEFAEKAQKILQLASAKKIDGFVSANNLTDIFYVLRKERQKRNRTRKAKRHKSTS
jgi:predicted nucleic acid-binding protein